MGRDRKVLFVDDEQNVLDTYRVSLRKRFKVDTALGPEEGLKKIAESGPYAVVVSDLKMPGMDGITLLQKIQDVSPDTIRIMLTGYADLDAATQAVNKGAVFRFLTKPSPLDTVIDTLTQAMKQYSLVVAEKELLRGTLRGCIKVLTDILGMASPEAFGRSERVRRLAGYVAKHMGLKHPLPLDLAAMLSLLGLVTLPETVLKKAITGQELEGQDQMAVDMVPSITANMLSQIPRMDKVSNIILHQNDNLEENPTLSQEARILKACLDYDLLIQQGMEKHDAIDKLRSRKGIYDLKVIGVLEKGTAGEEGYVRREVEISRIIPGMILDESLWSVDGVHLMADGTEFTETALVRLQNFRRSKRLRPSVRVLVPVDKAE